MSSDDENAFYTELSTAVYQFIADKFNVSAHGLTSDKVRVLLRGENISNSLLEETIGILNTLGFGRFAGGSGASTGKKELFEQARSLIVNLEEAL